MNKRIPYGAAAIVETQGSIVGAVDVVGAVEVGRLVWGMVSQVNTRLQKRRTKWLCMRGCTRAWHVVMALGLGLCI